MATPPSNPYLTPQYLAAMEREFWESRMRFDVDAFDGCFVIPLPEPPPPPPPAPAPVTYEYRDRDLSRRRLYLSSGRKPL